jgi:threonine dehydrogenase-like Zn-dependent dehydrogenase
MPESQRQAMRAPFQVGHFPAPVKYGYIAVGRVREGPNKLMGKSVFCLHPHQTRFQVPVDALTPLPDGLPAERAVLAANMETAVNACWDAQAMVGDRVAVIGAGVVGCLIAHLMAQVPGLRVALIDPLEEKRAIANALNLAFRTPDEVAGAGASCDLVVHASGNPAGLQLGLELAAFEGRVIEVSWYGNQSVPLNLGEGFHSRRLQIISSQVGQLGPHRRARWTHASRMQLALDLLRDPVYDALISGEDRFQDLPDVMAHVADDPRVLCHRLRYLAADR